MPGAERVILVVGVGRSGTSLMMQALDRLGAGLSQDLIPASDTNRRGTFEDRDVRDRMTVLGHRFGHFTGRLLPADWQEDELARETRSWLEGHLAGLSEQCGSTTLAVKFPLSSIFLPLWHEAAAAAGLELRPVWATRRAEDVTGSLQSAYGFDPDKARSRFLLRMHYLLKDLPPETLLLPYEGWREAPEEQIRALAEAAALPVTDTSAILSDLFEPGLDHGRGETAAEAEDPTLRRIDETVLCRRGLASELFGPDLAPLRTLAGEVAEALPERGTEPEETGKLRAQLASRNNCLRRLEEETSRQAAEIARLGAALEASRRKAGEDADAAAQSLRELRTAYEKLTHARDAEDLKRSNLLADHQIALEQAQKKIEAARQSLREAEARAEAARREQMRKSAWAKRAEGVKIALRSKLTEAEQRAKTAEQTCQAYGQELETLYGSLRWRTGDMIAQAYQRPRPRDLLLPVRLIRLWVRAGRGE